MITVTASHFGGNIVLTKDSAESGTHFREMLNEITHSNLRYPGGSVTEQQTWQNGGLQRVFGKEMKTDDPNYVMTLREALKLSVDSGATISIVIPTFQFLDRETGKFDRNGFTKYLSELEKALSEHPEAKVSSLEIGNEFWAQLSPSEYGFIANKQIPALFDLAKAIGQGDGPEPKIALQAGAAWRETGPEESREIAAELSIANRAMIGEIVQHAYPNAQRQLEWQKDWAVEPMKVYSEIRGFESELRMSLTEFNMLAEAGPVAAFGVNQAAFWIEEFARYINSGINSIDFWGGSYKWLTTKMYDAQLAPGETEGGRIVTKATPMGQVYDIASTHLIGKRILSDEAGVRGIDRTEGLGVSAFQGANQRVLFLSNMTGERKEIDLESLQGRHVSVHHIRPADSPVSTWYDESKYTLHSSDEILDPRGDMNVKASRLMSSVDIGPNELIVIIVSGKGKSLFLEGAHNETDPGNRMTNDVIAGAAGNDTIYGHAGDDYLYGRLGRDIIFGGHDNDRIWGGQGYDRLFGNSGDDRISGGQGNDSLGGGHGNNLLSGGQGYDILSGGYGDDTLRGGTGRDVMFGGYGDDLTFGDAGSDTIYGGNGRDSVSGGSGNDALRGQAGDDVLSGNSGNDRLFGGSGNDRLYGGTGDDHLSGGSGADVFIFTPFQGSNIVHDYDTGEDRIVIRGTSSDRDLAISEVEHGLEIYSNGTTILLKGLGISDASEIDFIFQ